METNQERTKKCKHCKTDIPYNAKVCPNCRKKQSGVGKFLLIVLIIFIAIVAISSCNKDSGKAKKVDSATSTEKSKDSETKSTEKSKFSVGETAELNKVQVTLKNVTESQGSEFAKPKDGNVFVYAEFEITNNSEKELNISSAVSFDAYQDSYSTQLSIMAVSANKDLKTLDGTIAPGKKMDGIVAYEVPATYKELEINAQLNVWSSKKIAFDYKK